MISQSVVKSLREVFPVWGLESDEEADPEDAWLDGWLLVKLASGRLVSDLGIFCWKNEMSG